MPDTFSQNDHADAGRQKRRVALTSLLAALLLTGTKIGVGLWTNSLGILSEAAHSGLDIIAAGLTLWAVGVSSHPADREHHYGHGKIENLSALLQTVLLLVTCAWIIREAVNRLFFGEDISVNPNIWAFLVILLSIAVDYSRSRVLLRVARKFSSQALEADALHFSTDIWSSAVVLLGLCAVLAGERFNTPWLVHADAVAALVVAGLVIFVTLELGKRSIDDLLDRVPRGLHEQFVTAARQVPGVEEVVRMRLRRGGPQVFADLTITVGHAAAFERAHDIAHDVETALHKIMPEADIVVHVEPAAVHDENLTSAVRRLAARHGLSAHSIRCYNDELRQRLELHLEVNDLLSLDEAHRQTTEFERDLRRQWPGIRNIVTHIEPADRSSAPEQSRPADTRLVEKTIDSFFRNYPIRVKPHNIVVNWSSGELSVSFHCALDPAMPITEAHDLTTRLEDYLRKQIGTLGRVIIHVEPEKQSGT